MNFSEQLKSLRKQSKMSQEQLAEKINVSRQAVTKWETGQGIPDIDNMISLSQLFNITVDELLSLNKNNEKIPDYLYESVTEYDIDANKQFDLKLGGAYSVIVSGYDGEKIFVKLKSNTIYDIKNLCKVKIDDIKNRIDIGVNHMEDMTQAKAKEFLFIFIKIPKKYAHRIEIASDTNNLQFSNLKLENIEFDGKTRNVIVNSVVGHIELNCNMDMNIVCDSINGRIDVNQISATSKITVPMNTKFASIKKGIANRIYYEIDGERSENFSDDNATSIVELNGMKSELLIAYRTKQERKVR